MNERRVDYDVQAHLDRIECEHRRRDAATLRFATQVRWIIWSGISLVIVLGTLSIMFAAATSELAQDNRTTQREVSRQARVVIRQSCERLNETRRALRVIIARGDRNLAAFLREGTIDRTQYERALKASRSARGDLGDADCVELARKIPGQP